MSRSRIPRDVTTRVNDEARHEDADLHGYLLEVEIPVACPPGLAQSVVRRSLTWARELLRSADVEVPQRIRRSATSAEVSAAIATHTASGSFISDLRVACAERCIPLIVEPGQPSSAPTDDSLKTPFGMVRIKLEFPINIQASALL